MPTTTTTATTTTSSSSSSSSSSSKFSITSRSVCLLLMTTQKINPLIATLKPQSNEPS